MKYFIVIPTYNEKENITKLINEIKSVFAKNGIRGGVIIVDDNSPDGTGDEIDKLAKDSSFTFKIEAIHRKSKQGLGTAYITGYKHALDLGADIIQSMDADFSHKPEYLPVFYNMIKNNEADVVIGSRYVKGGGVENWNFYRKFLSRFASYYSKLILGLKVNDCSAGFIAWRKNVLQAIPLNDIKSNGYVFVIEMKYRAHKLGFRLKETPIIFPDRVLGKSKMDSKIIFEAIFKVLSLRFMKL